MTIDYVMRGTLFDADVEALINPVNCVGVMGKGLALDFKNKYPLNFEYYRRKCDEGRMCLGQVLPFIAHDRIIINFPTKHHWQEKSQLINIHTGMIDLVNTIIKLKINSIAFPAIGCGLGGLHWKDVKTIIVGAMGRLEGVKTIVFEPLEG